MPYNHDVLSCWLHCDIVIDVSSSFLRMQDETLDLSNPAGIAVCSEAAALRALFCSTVSYFRPLAHGKVM